MDAVEEYSVCCHKVHLRGATEVEICSDDTIAAVKLLQNEVLQVPEKLFHEGLHNSTGLRVS